jgi:hypothetical protein
MHKSESDVCILRMRMRISQITAQISTCTPLSPIIVLRTLFRTNSTLNSQYIKFFFLKKKKILFKINARNYIFILSLSYNILTWESQPVPFSFLFFVNIYWFNDWSVLPHEWWWNTNVVCRINLLLMAS